MLRCLFTHLLLAVCLLGCGQEAALDDTRLLRNPTVPIGAITRFEAARFDGRWNVRQSGGGAWDMRAFEVAGESTAWREQSGSAARTGTIVQRGPGILRIVYEGGDLRDLWVVWIDPDHQTAALGDPEGRFGFVVTRAGTARADQITAARQVLDFNGYRTETWRDVP
ncbi:hypothetical protein [Tateyamaria sp. SN3-11]|uniref:hypothetical protein n=1 Tax=Tateyamaria sp. SN3-11 TaxID=3092147 RepID=UPI0039E81D0F